MFKNVAGQKIRMLAINTVNNAPQSGDAANITLYLLADDAVTPVQLVDAVAREVDPITAEGLYEFDLSQGETNFDEGEFTGVSTNPNVKIIPKTVNTESLGGATGPGATLVTLRFTENGALGGVAVPDADVWLTRSSSVNDIVAGTSQTDTAGEVQFLLDLNAAYYVWSQKDGQQAVLGQIWSPNNSGPFAFAMPDAAAPVGGASSRYFTYQQFINRWGGKNVAKYSNKENDTTQPNYEALQDAFDYADEEIENSIRGGVITTPPPINAVTREWAMVIAFEHIYNARGLSDAVALSNKIRKVMQDVYGDMMLYRSGFKQFANVDEAVGNADFQVDSYYAEDPLIYMPRFVPINPEVIIYG